MQGYDVKQSSTACPLVFLMIDSTDHLAGKTGLSPTVTISKNGAAFGSPSGAVTEVGSGWYKVAGNATDTATLGPLALHATATGADPSDALYPVVAYDPQDAVHFGLSAIPNFSPGAAGGLFIAGSNAPTSITGTSNSAGLTLAGNGTGAGLLTTGGATGHGFAVVGGSSSGDGINITTTSGHGINSAPAGQAKHGIIATGSGNSLGAACDGARFVGGFNGIGLHGIAGGASLGLGGEGAKFEATSGNNNGITIVGFGTGHGMLSTSGSGATGDGFRAMAASTNGDGFSGISTGTGAGFRSSAIAVGMGATIAQFAAALFTLNTGEVYAGAVNGSVVKEIATNAGGGGGGVDIISINGTTFVGPNVPCTLATQLAADALDLIHLIAPTGPSTEFVEALTQLFYRFFPPGPSGEVVKSASDHTIKTKNSAGTTVTTQTWADDNSGSESVGSAS